MDETDRELLQKAAKAAGYWSVEFRCPDMLPAGWDPLADDAHAFRLAVKLRIDVAHFAGSEFVEAWNPAMVDPLDEPYRADPYAAARRAIVRAAAAMAPP